MLNFTDGDRERSEEVISECTVKRVQTKDPIVLIILLRIYFGENSEKKYINQNFLSSNIGNLLLD